MIVWTKFTETGYFRSKTEKVNISIFKLALVRNFSLNEKLTIFLKFEICVKRLKEIKFIENHFSVLF